MTLAGAGKDLPSPEGGLIAADTGGPVLFSPQNVQVVISSGKEQESRILGHEAIWVPKSGFRSPPAALALPSYLLI